MTTRWGSLGAGARYLLVASFAIVGLAFIGYSIRFGLRGLALDLSAQTYLYTPGAALPNLAIFSHMILGGTIMVLAPLQLSGRLRARRPRLHRATGYVIFTGAVATAIGGLAYIALRGTVAGGLMDVGSTLYGALMLVAAVQAVRLARARDFARHREWALRLFVLAMGSLIYRLHYVAWYSLTDGLWSTTELDGPFDQVQYFAFYLPYLALLELYLRWRPRRTVPAAG